MKDTHPHLTQLIRKEDHEAALKTIEELEEELTQIKTAISDPHAVRVNMLRGTIAVPEHLRPALDCDYSGGIGQQVMDLESEIVRLKAEIKQQKEGAA